MKKRLIIKDRSKIIYIKNRKVRTPCILDVTDREIVKIRLALKMAGIENYSVEPIPKNDDDDEIKIYMSDNKEVNIEELDFESNDESKTILEKLMNGE